MIQTPRDIVQRRVEKNVLKISAVQHCVESDCLANTILSRTLPIQFAV